MQYCPYKYKYQLVEWVVKFGNMTRYVASQLTKKQLYAIWFKETPTRIVGMSHNNKGDE